MKFALSVLFCAVLCSSGARAQLSIGPIVGAHVTMYNNKAPHAVFAAYAEKLTIDFDLGVVANVPLHNRLYFQPGVLYTRNGYVSKDIFINSINVSQHDAFYINTVQMPLSLAYKTKQINANRFFFSAGLILALNINGTMEVVGYSKTGNYIQRDLPMGKLGFNRLGVGVGANLGYEFKNGLSARANCQDLLTNLHTKVYAGQQRLTYFTYGVTLAYQFHLKKKVKEVKGVE